MISLFIYLFLFLCLDSISNCFTYSEHGILTKEEEDVEILAYGCDWSRKQQGLIASGSFYDKEIHIWNYDEN